MLVLDERDMTAAGSLSDILGAVEKALVRYVKGDFYQPERMHVDHESGTLLLMPCFSEHVFGTKVISLFPGNIARGIPVLNGIMILNNAATGEPLALLNGSKLTALRTGAAGAVSIRYLTPRDVTSLGVIGTSVQGLHQTLFALSVRSFSHLFLFDISRQRMIALSETIAQKYPDLTIHLCKNARELLENSRVVITATNAETPVLPADLQLLEGKHYVGIGSYKPYMKEYPSELFSLLDEVFVDTYQAAEESGDLIEPLQNGLVHREQIIPLGRVIAGQLPVEQFVAKTTLFKCVGMALFDLMSASFIYEKAREKGVGKMVKL